MTRSSFQACLLFLCTSAITVIAQSLSSLASLAPSTATTVTHASETTETRSNHITSTSAAAVIRTITTDYSATKLNQTTTHDASTLEVTRPSTTTQRPMITSLSISTPDFATYTTSQTYYAPEPVLILTMNGEDHISAFLVERYAGSGAWGFVAYIIGYHTHSQTLTYGEVITVANNAVSLRTATPGLIYWTPITATAVAAAAATAATTASTTSSDNVTTTSSGTKIGTTSTTATLMVISTPTQLETTYSGAVPSSFDVNSAGMLYSASATASSTSNSGSNYGHGSGLLPAWWGTLVGLVVFASAAHL